MKNVVFVAAHKACELPGNAPYLPVQAGAALHPDLGLTRDDAGENILAGSIGGGVHMGNEAEGRQAGLGLGDVSVNIAVLVHTDIAKAYSLHVFGNAVCKIELLGSAGNNACAVCGLSIKGNIIKESFNGHLNTSQKFFSITKK